MKRTFKSILYFILALSLLLFIPSCATKDTSASTSFVGGVSGPETVRTEVLFKGGVVEIQKYGNIVLDISPSDMIDAGFEYGDVLCLRVNGTTFMVPFCTNYSDVDTGALVARDAGVLIVAVNMGDFATSNGLAVKEKHEDGSYTWIFPGGTGIEDIKVEITMGEKGGYKDQYLIHQLERTNERADYSSDVVFANFRNISSGEIGKKALYRSSSPVNNELGRAGYADALASMVLVQSVMNLADNNEGIEGYMAQEGYGSPYYKHLYGSGKVIALNLGVDFNAAEFKSGLAEGLRFFSQQRGPYLIHCNEGKDRAGFVSALLAAYMGASFDQIVEDYMITYENYYHIEKGSEQYEAVKNSNIVSMLRTIAGASEDVDVQYLNLKEAAEAYISSLGLTEAEMDALRSNLSKEW